MTADNRTAYERLIDDLRSDGRTVIVGGNGLAKAQCPAHDDTNPSLAVTGIEGRVLIYCRAGCQTEAVLAALGRTMADLFDNRKGADYPFSDGRIVHRTAGKKFRQSGNTKGTALFHVEKIGGATTVHVVEGEQDVLAIEAVGGTAVCNAMGAGKAHLFDWTPLAGLDVIIVADKDEPGHKHAADVHSILSNIASKVTIVEAATGKDAADHIAAGHTLGEFIEMVGEDGAEFEFVTLTRLADVEPECVSWLWPGRIPLGKLVTLDGDPGLGKSTLALTFAAPITTAGTWPDGSGCQHPGAVLIMSAEDGLADTVRPRLDAAGADVSKVHAIEGVPLIDEDTGERTLRPPSLADVAALEEAINRTGARLLIIDVLMAYLPAGADSHKDQDIRRVLSRLAALADRTGCTILLLRHLNKANGRDPLYRGGGSIGIVGAARAGLLVATDPDDPDRRVLASVKSNLAPSPESLTYRLVGCGNYGVARVQWEGTTTHTARILLSEPADDDGAKTEAEQWLEDYLTEQGAVPSKTAKADAGKAGIRERTLQRAVSTLGVIVESRGFPRVTWWLPSRATDTSPPPGSQNLGATGATGDDQHERNGATALNSQSRQLFETGATADAPPGAPTQDTPGYTDRVKRSLANARNGHGADRCCPCGEELTAAESIARGYCEECRLGGTSGATPPCRGEG